MSDSVTVLMPTFNGAKYLNEQLDSLHLQTLTPSHLIVSDDGSTDSTCEILKRFKARTDFPVTLCNGPQRGVAKNVFSLLARAPLGFVALADQDDVWLPQKISRACDALVMIPPAIPALYTAQRIITDSGLKTLGVSRSPRSKPSFANAVIQNIAPGNTIVLNGAAVLLAKRAVETMKVPVPFHDWWLYQLITGAGGEVIFDETPVLFYRQHQENLLGAASGFLRRVNRLKALVNGTYGTWIRAQLRALHYSSHLLKPDAVLCLENVLKCLDQSPATLGRTGAFRQSRGEQMLFRLAASVGCL